MLTLVRSTSASGPASAAASLAGRYSRFAAARPVASNVLQGGILFVGGDLLAQAARPETDVRRRTAPARARRALTAGAFGATYIGLAAAQWYRLMDRALPGHAAGPLVAKIAANCLVLGIGGNAANMWCRRYARSGCPEEAWNFTRESIRAVVIHDFRVWPAFDALCFSVVPLHLRPATAGVASLAWNTYLSLASNKDKA